MATTKELEIRGKFQSESELKFFLSKLEKEYGEPKLYRRLSVIFTDLNDKDIDIQVRLHNKNCQFVIKQGSHTSTKRHETKTEFDHTEFLGLIEQLKVLGIYQGVVAEADDWLFQIDKIEMKVTLCDKIILVWELEATDSSVTHEKLEEKAEELGLKTMSQDELKEYWAWMKKEANKKLSPNTIKSIYANYISKVKK
jgi:hypothetical protein